MSVSAADVNNREPDLAPLFEAIEADVAHLSLWLDHARGIYLAMSSNTRRGLAGRRCTRMIEMLSAQRLMLQGELMRLRQAED